MNHLKNLSASPWLCDHSSSCHRFIFSNPQGMVRLVLLCVIMGMVTTSPFLCFAEESLIPKDPAERVGPGIPDLFEVDGKHPDYEVTRNHLHVGFRWQPYADQPKNSEADIERELGKVGSYASFWYMSLHTLPQKKNLDYKNYPSREAQAIRHAIKLCKQRGIKTELVIWQVPLWMNGGEEYADFNMLPPDNQAIYEMVKKTVEWFGEDVDYYGIFHEANHPKYWEGDWDELMELFILPAARAIRDYSEETGDHKIVSTAGLSPSRNCKEWYDVQLESPELMGMIDNFALNLSDFNNGWGGGLLTWVSSVWDQMEYMDERLNEEGYFDKGIVAAESWICWDGRRTPHGPEGIGDTVESTLRILGECLQRGLGLTNLPWADNNSPWTMGLTKRIDYNGQLAKLGEELYPNFMGGPAIASRKLNLRGPDHKLSIHNDLASFEDSEFGAPYAVPDDPNHTHYYVWRWFAQLSAGQNECIHHTIAGEEGNDIILSEVDEDDYMRASSYDRTNNRFIVLLARQEADEDPEDLTITLPATIQKGARYHRDEIFVGEGFSEGEEISVRWVSEDIEPRTGYRENKISSDPQFVVVTDGLLSIEIPESRRLTTVIFESR